MQDAVPAGTGSMAAIIGLADDLVVQACEEVGNIQLLGAANFNSPGQVVIAGYSDVIKKAVSLCKEKGAKRAIILPVSVPSHCMLMFQAAKELAKEIDKYRWKTPLIPVVQNVTAKTTSNVELIKKLLVEQLYMPVLWSQSIAYLGSQYIKTFVECGPGSVLSGLNKRCLKGSKTFSIDSLDRFDMTIKQINS